MILENYLLSFPERIIRSAAALVGGTSLLLTETLLPEVVRSTTTYRVLVGDLQKTLITRLAQVDVAGLSPGDAITDRYLRKKIAGSFLEAIGLLTVRFSPVWALAIIGDAAGGSQVFLQRLARNLEANGIIDPGVETRDLGGLLAAIQKAANTGTQAIDTPPFNSEELANITSELKVTFGEIGEESQEIMARISRIGGRMDEVADEYDLSYEQVGGMMAIDAAQLSRKGVMTGLTISQTGGELFVEQILDSYGKTLDRISSQGPGKYLGQSMGPFLEAALSHFDPARQTWTENNLLGADPGTPSQLSSD